MSTATARFIALFGGSLLRRTHSLHPISHTQPQPQPQLFSTSALRFRRRCRSSSYSSSAAAISDSETILSSGHLSSAQPQLDHPWPEWVAFVDRLIAKGYVQVPPLTAPASEKVAEDSEIGVGEGEGDGGVYRDIRLLKEACLSFARHRLDVFKSLSREDIRTVVEKGCPNLLRKAVNSAKRLRLHVQLDEANVCSACSLRGSCDRAYLLLRDSEGAAGTVDVVRILLSYALDSLVISGGTRPPGRDLVEESARKLLSELTELSETPVDPEVVDRAANTARKTELPSDDQDDKFSRDVEMKRGDWMCPKCNFMNFARNVSCRRCGEDGPRRAGSDDVEMRQGDWICSECNFMNFARNIRCLKCKAMGPVRVSANDVAMKKGDWNCPQCGFMNFASNTKCLRCRENRPPRQLNPGEWECPTCRYLNFKGNKVCKKCNCECPDEVETAFEA